MVQREDRQAVPIPMMGQPSVPSPHAGVRCGGGAEKAGGPLRAWSGLPGSEVDTEGVFQPREKRGREGALLRHFCTARACLLVSFSPSPPSSGPRISQVQPADAGTFTCVAASPAGVADRNFTLRVLGTEQVARVGPVASVGRVEAHPWPIWV